MADLRERQRKSMNKDVFAYVDDNGEGHLPLNDETHVRNAMDRLGARTRIEAVSRALKSGELHL